MAKLSVYKYQPVKLPQGKGFSSGFVTNVKQVNNLGISLTGIANSTKSIHTLHEFQSEYLQDHTKDRVKVINNTAKEAEKRYQQRKRVEEKLLNKKQDTAAENLQETDLTPEDEKASQEAIDKEKEGKLSKFLGLFRFIGAILKPLKGLAIALGLFTTLEWIEKNPEKVENAINFFIGWGKFGMKILSWGIGNIGDSLTSFGDILDPNKNLIEKTFSGLKGVLQLIGGLGGLWFASRVFMPWKLVGDFKALSNLFTALRDQGEDGGPNQRPNRNQRTRNASKEARKRYQRRFGKDASRKRFGGKIRNNKWAQKVKRLGDKSKKLQSKLGKWTGKLGKMKGLTKFAKIGAGVGAVFSGVSAYQEAIAAGKTNAEAVGLGVGKAAGGMAGAAIATAFLGPFIGPFAPILGSIVGEWVGGWVGEKLGPIIEGAFKGFFKFLGKMREFVQNLIRKIVAIQIKVMKPALDFIFMFVDIIQKGLDYIKPFIEFIADAAVDVLVKGVMKIINGAKAVMNFVGGVKEKTGQVLNAVNPLNWFKKKPEEKMDGGKLINDTVGKILPPQLVYKVDEFNDLRESLSEQKTIIKSFFKEKIGAVDMDIVVENHQDIINHPKAPANITVEDITQGKVNVPDVVFDESHAKELTAIRRAEEFLKFNTERTLIHVDAKTGKLKVKGFNVEKFKTTIEGIKKNPLSAGELIENFTTPPKTFKPDYSVDTGADVPTGMKDWGPSISPGPSINNTSNSMSSLSFNSNARSFDRQVQGGSAAILIQKIRQQTVSQSTSELVIMRPNPSATVNC